MAIATAIRKIMTVSVVAGLPSAGWKVRDKVPGPEIFMSVARYWSPRHGGQSQLVGSSRGPGAEHFYR